MMKEDTVVIITPVDPTKLRYVELNGVVHDLCDSCTRIVFSVVPAEIPSLNLEFIARTQQPTF